MLGRCYLAWQTLPQINVPFIRLQAMTFERKTPLAIFLCSLGVLLLLSILATLVRALEEMGVRDPALHLAAVRSWGTLCLLAKRSPFTDQEIGAIRRFAAERWFDLLHYPGMEAKEPDLFLKMPSDDYYRAFSALLSPDRRRKFLDDYLFDVTPRASGRWWW